jgi:hypothetical protein
MGDTVQSVLERMVPELEDLQARGIFTPVSAVRRQRLLRVYAVGSISVQHCCACRRSGYRHGLGMDAHAHP